MKLTKLQRYTAYCIMLAAWENHEKEILSEGWGFCHLSQHLFDAYPYPLKEFIQKRVPDNDDVVFEDFYPELFSKIPNPVENSHWFDTDKKGWNKRVKLLKQCISETEPK